MDRIGTRTLWTGVILGVTAIGLVLAFAVDPTFDPRSPIAVLASAAALNAAVAAMAWSRYRYSGDPHALLVCVGFSVLAIQTAIFGVAWPILTSDDAPMWAVSVGASGSVTYSVDGGWEMTSVYGWQAGWLLAAGTILLGRPWWERRGRPPLRPISAFLGAAAALVLIDGILIRVRPDRFPSGTPRGALTEVPPGIVGVSPTTAGWILAVVAVALLAIVIWRENRASSTGPSPSAWLATAFLLAVPLQLAVATHPAVGLPFVAWTDVFHPAVAAIAFAGYLVHERAEVSRMRRASDRADEVMEGRAEIAAMVSHEVRGPVSTIRGLASTARNQYERLSEDERREFLEMIETESDRLLDTATQASLGLKVDAQTLTYDLRLQDLEPAILAGVTASPVGEHPVAIEIEPGLEVTVDRKWFAEVIHQLVDNAAKFSPPDAPIDVTARREEDAVVVVVSDRGPGIPIEHRETIFEKFTTWRPDGYSQAPGSGLGLFIAGGIVAAHKGTLLPADREGGGTMLRIRLPRTEG